MKGKTLKLVFYIIRKKVENMFNLDFLEICPILCDKFQKNLSH